MGKMKGLQRFFDFINRFLNRKNRKNGASQDDLREGVDKNKKPPVREKLNKDYHEELDLDSVAMTAPMEGVRVQKDKIIARPPRKQATNMKDGHAIIHKDGWMNGGMDGGKNGGKDGGKGGETNKDECKEEDKKEAVSVGAPEEIKKAMRPPGQSKSESVSTTSPTVTSAPDSTTASIPNDNSTPESPASPTTAATNIIACPEVSIKDTTNKENSLKSSEDSLLSIESHEDAFCQVEVGNINDSGCGLIEQGDNSTPAVNTEKAVLDITEQDETNEEKDDGNENVDGRMGGKGDGNEVHKGDDKDSKAAESTSPSLPSPHEPEQPNDSIIKQSLSEFDEVLDDVEKSFSPSTEEVFSPLQHGSEGEYVAECSEKTADFAVSTDSSVKPDASKSGDGETPVYLNNDFIKKSISKLPISISSLKTPKPLPRNDKSVSSSESVSEQDAGQNGCTLNSDINNNDNDVMSSNIIRNSSKDIEGDIRRSSNRVKSETSHNTAQNSSSSVHDASTSRVQSLKVLSNPNIKSIFRHSEEDQNEDKDVTEKHNSDQSVKEATGGRNSDNDDISGINISKNDNDVGDNKVKENDIEMKNVSENEVAGEVNDVKISADKQGDFKDSKGEIGGARTRRSLVGKFKIKPAANSSLQFQKDNLSLTNTEAVPGEATRADSKELAVMKSSTENISTNVKPGDSKSEVPESILSKVTSPRIPVKPTFLKKKFTSFDGNNNIQDGDGVEDNEKDGKGNNEEPTKKPPLTVKPPKETFKLTSSISLDPSNKQNCLTLTTPQTSSIPEATKEVDANMKKLPQVPKKAFKKVENESKPDQ